MDEAVPLLYGLIDEAMPLLYGSAGTQYEEGVVLDSLILQLSWQYIKML